MEQKRFNFTNDEGHEQLFLYKKQNNGIMLIKYLTDNAESVVIPSTIEGYPVVSIGENCFFCHDEIKEIQFPDSLKKIDNQAFAMCKRIKELFLPDSVEEIGIFAFRDCKSLEKVVLPRHLKVLRHGIFAFCNLSDVDMKLPDELETIETHAFYSAGLFDLVIPESVKEIQPNAFECLGPNPITSLPNSQR